jgi:polysaccharide pyruvyl transferase WcaK-like protein
MEVDRIAVCGSFGYGNAGDEAIPLAFEDMLQELGAKLGVTPVSRFREGALKDVVYLGPQDSERRNQLAGAPMLVSGGGVIEPQLASVLFRTAPLFRAVPKGRAMVFGSSVEPGVSYSLRNKWRLFRALSGLGTVYTRDVLSERSLNKVAPWVKTETIGDLVLWMKPQHDTPLLSAMKLPSRYIAVVLAPRWAQDAGWTNWVTTELVSLAREMKAAIVFVPMSCLHDDDRVEHGRIAGLITGGHSDVEVHDITDPLEPREVCSILARSVLTVSMRLHGCVMAHAQRVPTVCIAYHPKLLGFSETMGCLQSALPRVPPERQTAGFYGYDFAELKLQPGDLSAVASVAMGPGQHGRLDEFKNKSLRVLKQFLAL